MDLKWLKLESQDANRVLIYFSRQLLYTNCNIHPVQHASKRSHYNREQYIKI